MPQSGPLSLQCLVELWECFRVGLRMARLWLVVELRQYTTHASDCPDRTRSHLPITAAYVIHSLCIIPVVAPRTGSDQGEAVLKRSKPDAIRSDVASSAWPRGDGSTRNPIVAATPRAAAPDHGGGAMTHGRTQRTDRGLAPHERCELLITSLIDHHLLLGRTPDEPTLASLGTVHHQLSAALDAARGAASSGPDEWLNLRERAAQTCLQACPRAIASRIRFRSHEWSNTLHALAEMHHDEDLALLAEEFCIDSRIILGATVPGLIPPAYRTLGAQLVHCYQAGGWPCGWQGVFPAGRFEIYVRPVAP